MGNDLGLVGQVGLVALGLGALVSASAAAYTVLKLAGAAYVLATLGAAGGGTMIALGVTLAASE